MLRSSLCNAKRPAIATVNVLVLDKIRIFAVQYHRALEIVVPRDRRQNARAQAVLFLIYLPTWVSSTKEPAPSPNAKPIKRPLSYYSSLKTEILASASECVLAYELMSGLRHTKSQAWQKSIIATTSGF